MLLGDIWAFFGNKTLSNTGVFSEEKMSVPRGWVTGDMTIEEEENTREIYII